MTSPKVENVMSLLDEVLVDGGIPAFCCDSFMTSPTPTGLLVVMQLGPETISKLLLPFPTAESLARTIDSALRCRQDTA